MQYTLSTHEHVAVHPVRSAVTVQYMIFKATKKSEHRYFLFLELTILLKALSRKNGWGFVFFFLREQRINREKNSIPKFIYISSVCCELESV